MDWKIVIDGVAKATLAVFIFEVLARLAIAFNIGIDGLIYLDALFAALLVLTILGYGVYYGRTYGAPISLVATVVLGVSGFALALVALLGFPAFSSPTRTQLFWLGTLMVAFTIPLGSYASRRIRREWHDHVTDFEFGHHSQNLAREYGSCADGKQGLSTPSFAEPVVSSGGGTCEGAGVRIEWDRDSVVFRSGAGNAIAVAGRGRLETSHGHENLDGICVVSSACPLRIRDSPGRDATDADAANHEFKTISDLKGSVVSASSNIANEAESFVREAISRYNPDEKVESVSVGGLVNVEETPHRKIVRVPGVYVYDGPDGEVVRVGGRVVKNEIRTPGAMIGFSGVFKEGEKPVTGAKNLSGGLSFVVMGPHWVAWKKDEKVSSQ
jgi:hypothetical protein